MSVLESPQPPGPARAAAPAGATRAGRPGLLADAITLVRPLHSAKSVLAVPLVLLDAPAWTLGLLERVGFAVAAFVLASGAVYIGNDIADRHRDREHPVKRNRPIAAGRISVRAGYLYCVLLLAALGAVIAAGPTRAYWPLLVYMALNVAYSRGLKHIPLVDVGIIAFGFVLRVVQGYVATGTEVSGWLLITVFSLALLMISGKRRNELTQSGALHRPALRGYSVEFANHLLQFSCVLTFVAGLTYLRTEAPFGPYSQLAMLFSTPFAFLALFRFLQVVIVDDSGGDPVRVLLRDRAMVGTCMLWGLVLGATLAVAHYPGVLRAVAL
ncbi:MAG TPA: UbiA prenyltransferase family protein [Streptosporangiaceae bacterium]